MFNPEKQDKLTIDDTVMRAEFSVYPRASILKNRCVIPSDAGRIDVEALKSIDGRIEVRRLGERDAPALDAVEEPWVVDVRGVFRAIRNSLFAALKKDEQRNFVERGPADFEPEYYSALDFARGCEHGYIQVRAVRMDWKR